MNPVRSLMRQVYPHTKLNILTFTSGEEKYIDLLDSTDNHIYVWTDQYDYYWNDNVLEKPSLISFLKGNLPDIPQNLNIDLIICQDRLAQYELAEQLSHKLHCPLILISHVTPENLMSHPVGRPIKLDVNQWAQFSNRNGHYTVHTSEASLYGWEKGGFVIRPTVNTSRWGFYPQKQDGEIRIGFSPDMDEEEKSFLHRVCLGMLANPIIGKTMQNSTAFLYNQSYLYLNIRQGSIPIDIIEALACSIPIVTLESKEIHEVVKHGINGFVAKSEEETKHYINLLKKNPELREQMSQQALILSKEYHENNDFTGKMNQLFNHITGFVYTR